MGLSGYQKAPDFMNGTSGREAAIFSGQSPRKNVATYDDILRHAQERKVFVEQGRSDLR